MNVFYNAMLEIDAAKFNLELIREAQEQQAEQSRSSYLSLIKAGYSEDQAMELCFKPNV